MSGHTPGPWLVRPTNFGTFVKSERVTGYLAEVRHCRATQDVKADARLIAAAPELLDALQRLNSATRRYMEERPESDAEWASDETSVLSIVDAAIAKATGGPA